LGASDAGRVAIGGLVPRGSTVPPMLEFVQDARHVYDIIRTATRIRSVVAPLACLIARGAIIRSSTQNLLVQNRGCSSTQAV